MVEKALQVTSPARVSAKTVTKHSAGSGGCEGITGAGQVCQASAMTGKRFCFFHDPSPEGKQAHRTAAKRGGDARQGLTLEKPVPIPLDTPEAILDLLALAAGVAAQQMPSIAQSRALSAISSQALRVLERVDLNARIQALEAGNGHGNGS